MEGALGEGSREALRERSVLPGQDPEDCAAGPRGFDRSGLVRARSSGEGVDVAEPCLDAWSELSRPGIPGGDETALLA